MLADFGKREWNASLRAWNDLYLGLTYKSKGLIATKLLVRLKKSYKKIVWIITTPGERQACVLWGIWLNSFPHIR
jgi:hypothetical protein